MRAWIAAVVTLTALVVTAAAAAADCTKTSVSDLEDEVMCPVCGTSLGLAREAPQAQARTRVHRPPGQKLPLEGRDQGRARRRVRRQRAGTSQQRRLQPVRIRRPIARDAARRRRDRRRARALAPRRGERVGTPRGAWLSGLARPNRRHATRRGAPAGRALRTAKVRTRKHAAAIPLDRPIHPPTHPVSQSTRGTASAGVTPRAGHDQSSVLRSARGSRGGAAAGRRPRRRSSKRSSARRRRPARARARRARRRMPRGGLRSRCRRPPRRGSGASCDSRRARARSRRARRAGRWRRAPRPRTRSHVGARADRDNEPCDAGVPWPDGSSAIV